MATEPRSATHPGAHGVQSILLQTQLQWLNTMAAPLSCSAPTTARTLPSLRQSSNPLSAKAARLSPTDLNHQLPLRFHTNVHEGLSHIHLHSLLAWGNVSSKTAGVRRQQRQQYQGQFTLWTDPLQLPLCLCLSAALGYAWSCWTNSINSMWKSHTSPPSPSF